MKKCSVCGRTEENRNMTVCSLCGGRLNEIKDAASSFNPVAFSRESSGDSYFPKTPVPRRERPKEDNTVLFIAVIVLFFILVINIIAGSLILSRYR